MRLAAEWLAMAAAYIVFGKLGLQLAPSSEYMTAVFPPAGIALAAVLLTGFRVWPGIWLGSFLLNFWLSWGQEATGPGMQSIALAASLATGASLQAIVGAWFTRRLPGYPDPFCREQNVIRFLGLAGPVACLISATVGATSLVAAGVLPLKDYLFGWWIWWAGDTIGIFIFAPLMLIGFFKPWQLRRFSMVLPLCVSLVLILVLFIYTSAWEQSRIRRAFEEWTADLAVSVQGSLRDYLEVLHSIASFYDSSAEVSREEFQTFARHLLQRYPGIQVLSWNPRVEGSDRAAFEESVRREGHTTFVIRERGAGGGLVPATARPEYVVVTYVEPYQGNENALGFDVTSDAGRLEALSLARDQGEPIATGRTVLVQEAEGQFGWLVFHPVYAKRLPHETIEERRRNLIGYATAAFRVGDVMNAVLKNIGERGIEARLYDKSAARENQLLYSSQREQKGQMDPGVASGSDGKPSGLSSTVGWNIAGRDWSLDFAATPEYLSIHRSLGSWSVPACGMLFTGFLSGFLLLMTARTSRIEEEVKLRTFELRGQKDELNREVAERRKAQEQIHRLNEELEQRVNERTAQLQGANELLGKAITDRNRAKRRILAFSRLGQELSSASTIRKAGEKIVNVADSLFGWDACFLHLYRSDNDTFLPVLTMDVINGRRADIPIKVYSLEPGNRVREVIAGGGQLILRDDLEDVSDELRPIGDVARRSASLMFVPIRHGQSVVGILSVQSYIHRAYNKTDLQTFQALADHCGGALQRIWAQESLEEAERKYRSIFENAAVGLFQTTREGLLLSANSTLARMLGYNSAAELMRIVTDVWRQLWVTPESRDQFQNHIVENGAVENYECHLYQKDGSVILASINGRAKCDSDGAFLHYEGTVQDITERKLAEEKLRESEENYRELFERHPRPMWFYDKETLGFLAVNDAAIQHYGYSKEEFLKMTIKDIRPTEDVADLLSLLNTPLTRLQSGYWKHCKKDGTVIDVEITSHDVDFGKRPSRIVVAQDITDRIRVEQERERLMLEVESQQKRLDATISSVPGVVWEAWGEPDSQKQRINFVSNYVEKLLGYTVAEWLATPNFWLKIVHPEDKERAARDAHGIYVGRERGISRFRWVGKDGRHIWMEAQSTVIVDDCGAPVGMRGVTLDITERQQAVEALRESEERFRVTFEEAAVGMALVSLQGRFVRVNQKLCSTLDYTKEEMLARTYQEVTHPEDIESIVDRVNRIRAGEKSTFSLQSRCQRVDGTFVWTELNVSLVRKPTGEPDYLIAVIEDITTRRNLEIQIRQAQKMDAIGQLASGVAHDLNNSLAPIMMVLGLLKEQYPGESSMLDLMENSARRGAEMVRRLLTFAKGKEGARVPVNSNRLLEEMETMMRGTFPKNIKIIVNTDAGLPTVMGDATQLHQVLLNFCVNARDAMPDGGTITIESRRLHVDVFASSIPDAKPGSYVALSVRDTGMGIPQEILHRVFDPFFTTKEGCQGTGLGLFTAMGIVKGHGGFVQVDSLPGGGSTFTACLPVGDVQSASIAGPKSPGEFRGNGEVILHVEDDKVVREVSRIVLKRLNLTPVFAEDGEDGLRQVMEYRDKLRAVITDLTMPQMDGLEFVRQLRSAMPAIPIIVASGRMEPKLIEQFDLLGASAYLDKPFTERELAEALAKIFSKNM